MRTAVAAALAAVVIGTAGCSSSDSHGPGPTVDRDFQVGQFDRISLAGAYDATVRTGSSPSVHARGGQNQLDRLVVEVDNGELKIHPKQHFGFHFGGWGKSGHVQLTITVPQLRGADLAGSGGIDIDKVQGDRFEGTIAGSGDLRVGSLSVQSLKLSIAGSGDAKAGAGTAKTAEYEIAGSGGVDAGAVQAEQLKVSIAGSGSVKARASGAADVSMMGSGDVDVAGGAKCNISKAGSGSVHCS